MSIRRVAGLLNEASIPIEAGLLFTAHGRATLRPHLDSLAEMQISKTQSEPLRGAIVAGSLTLPEKSELDADTVIIVKEINFTGRNPTIKGPHDIHIFVFDSVKSTKERENPITIDASGTGRKEWLRTTETDRETNHASSLVGGANRIPGSDGRSGTAGVTGENGISGVTGDSGSCSRKTGGAGSSGTMGATGKDGGAGGNGANGTDASNVTLFIPNTNAARFHIITKGGDGGQGGRGGDAGIGGQGGDGGRGGDGIGCACGPSGIGEGGSGGAGGTGGTGGSGGKGGTGGRGGNGSVVIVFQGGHDPSRVTVEASAGSGGIGGGAGAGARGGAAGTSGQGGPGGIFSDCGGARAGAWGEVGKPGKPGKPGEPGLAGQPGNPGHMIFLPANEPGPNSNQIFRSGYEPGAVRAKCTEWFWVSLRCDYYASALPRKDKEFLTNHAHAFGTIATGWQCNETRRTHIGCF